MIREYKSSDLKAIRSIHERSFPLIIDDYNKINLVYDCNGVKGLITARETLETILIIDPKLSKRERSVIAMDLVRTGIMQGQKLGYDETHAFLTGIDAQNWSRVLINKFGAQECKGIPLVLRF